MPLSCTVPAFHIALEVTCKLAFRNLAEVSLKTTELVIKLAPCRLPLLKMICWQVREVLEVGRETVDDPVKLSDWKAI